MLRRKNFEEVPIHVLGHFHDASWDADAVDEVGPFFGRGTGDRFDVLNSGEEFAKRFHGFSFDDKCSSDCEEEYTDGTDGATDTDTDTDGSGHGMKTLCKYGFVRRGKLLLEQLHAILDA